MDSAAGTSSSASDWMESQAEEMNVILMSIGVDEETRKRFREEKVFPATVHVLSDDQLASLGVSTIGGKATLRQVCGQSVRSKSVCEEVRSILSPLPRSVSAPSKPVKSSFSFSESLIERHPKRKSKHKLAVTKYAAHKPGRKVAPTFQKKLVVIKYMGRDAERTFTLKDAYVILRGMLPEIEIDAEEKTVRAHIRDTIANSADMKFSRILLSDFEFLEANGKRLCVPAQKDGFEWSARAVKQLSGHGSVYVRLTYDVDDYEFADIPSEDSTDEELPKISLTTSQLPAGSLSNASPQLPTGSLSSPQLPTGSLSNASPQLPTGSLSSPQVPSGSLSSPHQQTLECTVLGLSEPITIESEYTVNSSLSPIFRMPEIGESSRQVSFDPLKELTTVLPHVERENLSFLLEISRGNLNEISSLFLEDSITSASIVSLMRGSLLSGATRAITLEEYPEDHCDSLASEAFAFYKDVRFDPTSTVRIRIQNQPVVDTGGARRQFFNDVFSFVASSNLGLFEGPPNRLHPTFRQSSISSGMMNIMGKMVGHSILMDGHGFPFISPACYFYMAGHFDLAVSELGVEDTGERVTKVISRLTSLHTSDDVRELLESDCSEVLDVLQQCGCDLPVKIYLQWRVKIEPVVMETHLLLPSSVLKLFQYRLSWPLTAILLCCLAYHNGLHGDLVHDDIFAIKNNHDVHSTNHIKDILWNDFWGEPMASNTSHKSYRPVTVATFRLNYFVNGLDSFGYHLVNVFLHVVATVMCGCVCVRSGSEEWGVMTMVLFAVHPVHTEAVTGIVGRADLLACILFLSSFLIYQNSVSRNSLFKVAIAMILAALSMLSKEHGITVLGVCLLYDHTLHCRELYRAFLRHHFPRELYPLIIRSLVVMMTGVVCLGVRVWLMAGSLPGFGVQDNPASFHPSALIRGLTYSYLYYYNARLLVYPDVLSYDYTMGSVTMVTPFDLRNIPTIFFYISLLTLVLKAVHSLYSHMTSDRGHVTSKRDHVISLALVLLVIPFLPASNLFLRVGFVIAERILYIPSLGYCMLVCAGALLVVRRLPSLRLITLLLFTLLVVAFGSRTVYRNQVWDSRETLFLSGIRSIPHNAKAHFNYANFLKDSGRTQEAIHHYKTAVRLWPEHAVSHNNLGTLLVDLTEAEFHFKEAIQHNPSHFKAFYNLGNNLIAQGRTIEAEAAFKSSVNINPNYTEALTGLGRFYAEVSKFDQGLPYMERAVSVAPGNADVWSNLGSYLFKAGNLQRAIEAFEKALEIDHTHFLSAVGLAKVYRTLKDDIKTELWYTRAISIERDVSTLQALGAFYHNTGQFQRARLVFEDILEDQPLRLDTLCSYGQSSLRLGYHGDIIMKLTSGLARHETSACIHILLGHAHKELGDLEEAMKFADKAVDVAIDNDHKIEALLLLGGLHKDLGHMTRDKDHMSQAEQAYRLLLEISHSNTSAHLNLGALLHLSGDYAQAKIHYKAVLTFEPSNRLAKENLKKLERLL